MVGSARSETCPSGHLQVKGDRKAIDSFPGETFFEDAGGDNPRNNSAAIVSLMIDGKHMLFPSDTGVPALTPAMSFLDSQGRTAAWAEPVRATPPRQPPQPRPRRARYRSTSSGAMTIRQLKERFCRAEQLPHLVR